MGFEKEIRPLLEAHCLRCHGPEKQRSGYRLDDRAAALRGGDSGDAAIVPGRSGESSMVRAISAIRLGLR